MTFPPCKLCGVAPASCKSHIIPKQFYRRIRGAEKHLLELHVEKRIHQHFTQSGIWEQGILCPKCDGQLGPLDEYAYEVLPEHLAQSQIKRLGPGASAYEIGVVDVETFKKFLVALVWRASRSSHGMFSFLKIGPYQKRFEDILTGKDTSWMVHVDCVSVHLKPPRYDKILLAPFATKCEDVNVIQFYLYPWKLLIKLDRRPFGATWEPFTVKAGQSSYALMMDTFSQGELRMLANLQQKIKRHEAAKSGRKVRQ